MTTFVDRCTQYAQDVVSGKTKNVGKLVIAACQRHLDDIESSKLAPYRYYFDIEESQNIIDFAEDLTMIRDGVRQNVECYPYQCFILGSLNGWRVKETGNRRFRTSYVQLGRQNGKSFLNGILAAYYGNFTLKTFGKIYLTATKQEQANIIFDEVKKFINADEDLAEMFDIREYNHTIECLLTGSMIRALSGDTKSIDGFAVYLGIVDEYHAHRTNQMYKLLEGGMKMQDSALVSVITTAGFDLKSPCYRLYETCVKVVNGTFKNDAQFVYIAQLDEHDDIKKPENWIKANPILEFNKTAFENMIPIGKTAFEMGGEELRDFLVKQLNTWIQWSTSTYIAKMHKWTETASEKTLEDFAGQKCYIGIDLSSGGDLTTIALVFPFFEQDVKKYYVHTHSYMPASRVEEHIQSDDAPYDLWIKKGLITVTETLGGIKTDYKYIIADLMNYAETYDFDVQMICYDPHNASAFLGDLEATGFNSLLIKQSARYLSDATEDFRLEIYAGNVSHSKEDEVLTWSLANAKTITNNYGEIKIDKERQTERIDPVDAVIDAWTEAMKTESEQNAAAAVEEWLAMMKGGEEE